MGVARKLQKRMAEERARLLTEAGDSEPAALEERIRRLKLYGELLGQVPVPWWRRVGAPAAVAVVSLLCAGLLWRTPKTPTRVVLSVQASAVRMAPMTALKADLPLDSVIGGQGLSASGVILLDPSPRLGLPASDRQTRAVSLCEGQLVLDALTLSPQGPIREERPDEFLPLLEVATFEKRRPRIYAKRFSLQADFRLWGNVMLAHGPCSGADPRHLVRNVSAQLAETLGVTASADGIRPLELSFTIAEGAPLVFRDVRVGGLEFVTELAGGEGCRRFASTIEGGELTLADSGKVESLPKGTFLTLRGFNGRVRELQADGRIRVSADGTATSVLLGPEGYQRNLTPSYLEHLRYNKSLGLLWGAAVFVWGVLWGAKRLLAL
jgi:hypothetical protein